MSELMLIRHAPTQSNKDGKFMGNLDVPCTNEGLLHACELRKSLNISAEAAVYSSPLGRALTTAKAVFPKHLVAIDPRLAERGLGLWSGRDKKEVRREFPKAFLLSGKMDPFYTPPEGESWVDFVGRIVSLLNSISLSDDAEQVIAVSHNGVIRLIRCILEGMPFEHLFEAIEPHLEPRIYNLQNCILSTHEVLNRH